MPDIKEIDIIIQESGDESVGIFGYTCEIKQVTLDESLMPREELRSATKEYFEGYITFGYVNVYFSDELDKLNDEFYDNKTD